MKIGLKLICFALAVQWGILFGLGVNGATWLMPIAVVGFIVDAATYYFILVWHGPG